MPFGGRNVPFYRWKTLALCAYALMTAVLIPALTVTAFVDPAPLIARLVFTMLALLWAFSWMEVVSILWGRMRAYRGRGISIRRR
jgi:hypothetical protein